MTLFGLAAAEIKPTALVLNILVASIGTWQFWRAWAIFPGGYSGLLRCWPMPMAFLGGYLNLPTHAFKVLVGVVLLFSAARFFWRPADDEVARSAARPVAISLGAGMERLSGLDGDRGRDFPHAVAACSNGGPHEKRQPQCRRCSSW